MKTTALWILASVFAGISVVLGQTNHLTLSIWFGIISVAFLLASLFTHNRESKIKSTKEEGIENMNEKQVPTINANNSVVSVNQQNGITAHTVNVGRQDRVITQEQQAIIIRLLKPEIKDRIKIAYTSKSEEQLKLGQSLILALKSSGFDVTGENDLHLTTTYRAGLSVVVNEIPPYPKGSFALQKAFAEANIKAEWFGDSQIVRDEILVYIGD